jgi:hypothetical protein
MDTLKNPLSRKHGIAVGSVIALIGLAIACGPTSMAPASPAPASAQPVESAAPQPKVGAKDLELTYTKWFAPAPTMEGYVGGDIVGRFGGALLARTPISGGSLVTLKARYEIIANDPSRSFTALVEGTSDTTTGLAVLNGVVTVGLLTGQPVHVEFKTVTCTEAPNGTCFQGTIRVTGRS